MRWRLFLAPLALVVLLAYATPASATTITFNLDTEFSGADTPSGVPEVVFDDGGGIGSVTLAITSNLSLVEYISELYFNYVGDATTLNFAYQSGVAFAGLNVGGQYKADGDGFFDILFGYPKAPPAARFGAADTSNYLITGAGLTANDFNLGSAPGGGNGTFFVAAKVQGIGANGQGSGWVGDGGGPTKGPGNIVPEPSSLALLGFGVLLAARRLRAGTR